MKRAIAAHLAFFPQLSSHWKRKDRLVRALHRSYARQFVEPRRRRKMCLRGSDKGVSVGLVWGLSLRKRRRYAPKGPGTGRKSLDRLA